MNLIPIIDENEYNHNRKPGWPSYADTVAGHRAQDSTQQSEITALFERGLKNYLEQSRWDEISEGNRQVQGQIFFDKRVTSDKHHCTNAWNTLGVNSYGDVFICISPTWLPRFAGNILAADDIFNILNSSKARAIRNEILNKRYFFCNFDLCGHTRELNLGEYQPKPQQTQDFAPLTYIDNPDAATIRQIPRDLIFDFDHTCNYRCPSCRTDMINNNKHPVIAPVNQRIADRIKHMIIDRIEDQPIEIRWAGGEPFISKVYLDLMDYITTKHPKGNVRHTIQTNGSYLKSRAELIERLLPHMKEIRISFDAATPDTYHKVRVNGVWENLMENVVWFMDLVRSKKSNIVVCGDFVVQKYNYQEIPAFHELMNHIGITQINYQRMWNWGTWNQQEFNEMNVYHPEHDQYDSVLDLLEQVKWRHLPPERRQSK